MRLYVQVSGTIFGLVAVAQLLRFVMRVPVQAAGLSVPVWASALAFVFASALAIWAFRSARSAA